MGAMQRRKGSEGERELARIVRDELGIRPERNLEQTRDGGHDLLNLQPFAVEVKRHKAVSEADVQRYWREAVTQLAGQYRIPALAYRANRGPWRVVVPIYALDMRMRGEATHDFAFTAELTIEGFCALAREEMASQRANNGG